METKLRVLKKLGETLSETEKELFSSCLQGSADVPEIKSFDLTDLVSEELIELAK